MWTFIFIALLCFSVVAVSGYLVYDFIKSFKETKDYLEIAIIVLCGLSGLYFGIVAIISLYLAFHGNPQTEPPH